MKNDRIISKRCYRFDKVYIDYIVDTYCLSFKVYKVYYNSRKLDDKRYSLKVSDILIHVTEETPLIVKLKETKTEEEILSELGNHFSDILDYALQKININWITFMYDDSIETPIIEFTTLEKILEISNINSIKDLSSIVNKPKYNTNHKNI